MKSIKTLAGLILFIGFLGGAFYLLDKTNKNQIQSREEKGKLPNDIMFMQRAYPTGTIKTDAYRLGNAWKNQVAKSQRMIANVWEFVGPLNIGGRITDIEISTGTDNAIYVGAASGGIFRSLDNASSWQPIFDDQPMLAIGDIEISKSDTDLLYVGTGEPNAGGGSLAYDGDGIYKSTDGGNTWQSKGLENVGSISKVIIDPTDNNKVFVGAMGPLFRNDDNRGVYRSEDGGDTWSNVLFISNKTGIIDMAIHPSNSEVIYAVAWERERTPQNRVYGGATSGIYKSTDGGDNWIELTNGLPSDPSQKGRISIDISQSNPNVLYASYADSIGSIQGVYKTTDGGTNWVAVNSDQLTNVGFHWWFGGLFIDPSNENVVYHVGFDMQKTVDGGNNWQSTFSNVHVDQHALAFFPGNSSEIFIGNDGGLYRSTNEGDAYVKDLNLPITQFYRFYVDPQDDQRLYGGSQDNSTIRTTTAGLTDWMIINGGDGFQPLVNKDDSNTIYALSQRGNLVRSTNDALTFSQALSGINFSDRNNWDTPIAFDPADNSVMYYGTNFLYKSIDGASSWSAISPDLTNGSGMGNLSFGTITSIDVSPLNSNIIYAGTDDGNVWSTTDSGANWTNVSNSLPNRWVTRVQASPNAVNTVYVTFSGYRYGEDNGHVYASSDNGNNWSNISSGLPDIPINDIEIDEFNNLFLGTDIGVLASDDNGVTWQPLGDNLPSVVITDLHIDERTKFLYVGTYGRSAYKMDISENVLDIDDLVLDDNSFTIYPNPVEDELLISIPLAVINEKIYIYNQLGQLQKIKELKDTETKIDLSDLAKGVYILKIGQGISTSKKIVKK